MTAVLEKSVAEVLTDAAALLEKTGRVRGRFYDSQGRYCLMSAVHIAGGATDWWSAFSSTADMRASEALAATIAKVAPECDGHSPGYPDSPAMNAICQYNNSHDDDDVQALLMLAAANARDTAAAA